MIGPLGVAPTGGVDDGFGNKTTSRRRNVETAYGRRRNSKQQREKRPRVRLYQAKTG